VPGGPRAGKEVEKMGPEAAEFIIKCLLPIALLFLVAGIFEGIGKRRK